MRGRFELCDAERRFYRFLHVRLAKNQCGWCGDQLENRECLACAWCWLVEIEFSQNTLVELQSGRPLQSTVKLGEPMKRRRKRRAMR